MIFYLGKWLQAHWDLFSFMRLMNYQSFRAVMIALSTFLLTLYLGKKLIPVFYRRGWRDVTHDFGVIAVDDKRGTPTMGGLIMIPALALNLLAWGRLDSRFLWIALISLLWFGGVGFLDDYLKQRGGSGKEGLSQIAKLSLQLLFALFFAFYFVYASSSPVPAAFRTQIFVPFYKYALLDIHGWYVLLVIFTILAVANSVNFADGMDGLTIVPITTVYLVYALFAYLIGNVIYSSYLNFAYIPGAGEMAVIAAATMGAGLGFPWYNAYPAQVFLGDVGSQALGGMLAVIIILLKQEMLFLIAGGIFVVEGASVFIQEKIGFRLGRRIFFRAPIHHSFEYRGISETKLTVRFWIISVLLAFLSIISLKVR